MTPDILNPNQQPEIKAPAPWKPILGVLLIVLAAGGGFLAWKMSQQPQKAKTPTVNGTNTNEPSVTTTEGVKAFASESEFKTWLAQAGSVDSYSGRSIWRGNMPVPTMQGDFGGMGIDLGLDFAQPIGLGSGASEAAEPGRFSQTNVQTAAVDEPDIVKTDGKELYYARSAQTDYWRGWDYYGGGQTGDIKAVRAFPLTELKLDAEIAASGELLLAGKTLVVLGQDAVYGYDVADPTAPKETWKYVLGEKNQVAAARLYGGRIYLVIRSALDVNSPCPFMPLTGDLRSIIVPCDAVFHPVRPVPSDVTYTVTVLNPGDGAAEKTISFVGAGASTAIYMSEAALYVTHAYSADFIVLMHEFLAANNDVFPQHLIDRLAQLKGYQLSQQAKLVELETVLGNWMSSLTEDESLKLENDMANRLTAFMQDRGRGLESTGIVKVAVPSLEVAATGAVPGTLLNQFSLDEYGGFLRVATTVGEGGLPMGMGSVTESANDVYVLDASMAVVGSVKDMGKTERVYAVRFLADKGYVVTFRQTDPFYVIDLADPRNPQIKGELKIPGYSAYLHPITKDKILGIGLESGRVKVSLFDVSDPSAPVERSKYMLEGEGWTEIADNHHAFLLDDKHKVFFMPGGRGAYIMSYADDKLSLVKAVAKFDADRAVYIDEFLYLVGRSGITVLDEKTWEPVKDLALQNSANPQRSGNDSTRVADVKQMQTALELYFADHNRYPDGNNVTLGAGTATVLCGEVGWTSSCASTVYMGLVPSAPTTSLGSCAPDQNVYRYTAPEGGVSYALTFCLGSGVGNLTAGQRTANPNGIN